MIEEDYLLSQGGVNVVFFDGIAKLLYVSAMVPYGRKPV